MSRATDVIIYHGYEVKDGSISDYIDIMFHYNMQDIAERLICVQVEMSQEGKLFVLLLSRARTTLLSKTRLAQ